MSLMKMEQVVTIIDGDRGKNYPKQNEFFDEGYCLFLNTGNVTSDGFLFENNSFITQEKDKLLRKGKLKRNDLVYTTRGTVGNVAYYSDDIMFENIRINSGMIILRCNKEIVDEFFLYQLLKSSSCRMYFKQYCTGSAQPQLPIMNFKNIEVDIPNIETQHRIADILSTYDNLIENNKKQIKLLEEAAQRLYKEWFVDLRFPGYEDTKIVNGVSEGWKKGRADDFFNITIGKTPPRSESEWFTDMYKGIPWVSIADMGNTSSHIFQTKEGLTRDAVKRHNVKVVPAGTVLLSFKLTVGRVSITSTEMCTNEAIAHFYIPNDYLRAYTYAYLNNFHYDELGSTSSISKAVNSKFIKAMPFIMPREDLVKSYSKEVAPIFEQVKNKEKSIIGLIEARDRLLPKLMSGELGV